MQLGHPITFGSRQLKIHELNYPTHDLELAAVVHALKVWRHYLYGEKFEVFSDHKTLQHIFTQKDLNQRQRRWLEFLADYDFELHYHPGKANVVADAMSRKQWKNTILACVAMQEWKMLEYLTGFDMDTKRAGDKLVFYNLVVQPSLLLRVKEAQNADLEASDLIARCYAGTAPHGWVVDPQGCLLFGGKPFVPTDLRKEVMKEFHCSRVSVHPGSTKMYQDLIRQYRWPGMKADVATFISTCLVCQQVKAEHQRPAGELHPLPIPVWKWDDIAMDFVTGLPRTSTGKDSIWVVIDRLTKSAHFR